MNGANLGWLVFWVLLLQDIHLIYLLALKKATKHCDFISNMKIFRLVPVTETDTIMDAEICLSDICGSCDFPVALHLVEFFTVWQSVCERLSDHRFTFAPFRKVLSDAMRYKCSRDLVLSFVYLSHWQGGFGWLYRCWEKLVPYPHKLQMWIAQNDWNIARMNCTYCHVGLQICYKSYISAFKNSSKLDKKESSATVSSTMFESLWWEPYNTDRV